MYFLATNPFTGPTDVPNIIVRSLLIILTIVVALGIGLLLRRKLVERLKKTVLDNWIIQTLGILIILPTLIIAAPIALLITNWGTGILGDLAKSFSETFKPQDVKNFVWNLIQTILLIALGLGVARTIRAVTVRSLGESRIDINIRT